MQGLVKVSNEMLCIELRCGDTWLSKFLNDWVLARIRCIRGLRSISSHLKYPTKTAIPPRLGG